jgi:hypothetical protein
MKIAPTSFPTKSILNTKQYNYVDSFVGDITDNENKIKAIDVAKAFFSSAPQWVDKLFTLRNKIVRVFGLKTNDNDANRAELLANFKGEVGEQLGLFKVYNSTQNEIVLGEDDKHLNFRVSLLVEQSSSVPFTKNIIITTTVEFNNWFGKLYFLPVRPFHKLIVPTMLKGIITELQTQQH